MTDTIWLEKYRPLTLEEVQGNEESINTLKTISQEGNIPNMILVVNILEFSKKKTFCFNRDLQE